GCPRGFRSRSTPPPRRSTAWTWTDVALLQRRLLPAGRWRGDEPVRPPDPHQREVLQLIAEGDTAEEIARKLDLSVKPVGMHRTPFMAVLDIHDLTGLVRHAIRIGRITPDV